MKNDIALLVLRITFAGNMMIAHGVPKLINFSKISNNFPDPLGVGGKLSLILTIFAELFCSALIITGIKTRLATIPIIITMLVASFIIHAGDPWVKQEFPLIYAYGFLAILLLGPGKYALSKK